MMSTILNALGACACGIKKDVNSSTCVISFQLINSMYAAERHHGSGIPCQPSHSLALWTLSIPGIEPYAIDFLFGYTFSYPITLFFLSIYSI